MQTSMKLFAVWLVAGLAGCGPFSPKSAVLNIAVGSMEKCPGLTIEVSGVYSVRQNPIISRKSPVGDDRYRHEYSPDASTFVLPATDPVSLHLSVLFSPQYNGPSPITIPMSFTCGGSGVSLDHGFVLSVGASGGSGYSLIYSESSTSKLVLTEIPFDSF